MESYQREPALKYEEGVAVFKLVATRGHRCTWKEVQEAIEGVSGRQRNRKTVERLWLVTLELFRLEARGELDGLDETQAKNFARTARYDASPGQVLQWADWFRDWRAEHNTQARLEDSHLQTESAKSTAPRGYGLVINGTYAGHVCLGSFVPQRYTFLGAEIHVYQGTISISQG